MAEEFDPYRKWLGIPLKDQPPHHYRLLGIATFEDDPDVIENAASRQMTHVRTFQAGKHGPISQRILNELTAAKLCLLQPDKKQVYDAALRKLLAAAGQLSSSGVMDAAVEEVESYPPPPPTDFRSAEGRWRTSQDAAPEFPTVGVAPVPIPMPAPPPVGTSSLSGAQKIRRTGYIAGSSGRGRKSSSTMPMLLIIGSVALLALGGIVAVLMSMNQQSATNPPKQPLAHEKHAHEKPNPKRPTPPSTPFTVGANNRPSRPQPNRATPIVGNPMNVGTDPANSTADQNPREFLTKARQSLEHRNDSDFRYQISQAEYLVAQQKPADADALKAEEQHLRDVEKLLNNFWQAVREGADKKIPKGEKISFKRHDLEIIAREGDQLTYKFDGVEHVTSIKKLPPRVAMYMALRVFGQENLDGKIAIVVFQLIDAEAARDTSCQRLSGRLLEDIEQAGVSENPVLQRERGKATKAPENKEEELSGPLIIGSVAPEKSPDKPFEPNLGAAVAGEPKQLDPMLVKDAREKFDKEIRPRMLQATEDLAVAKTLLADFKTELEKAETAEFKVKLLKEGVIDLAARVGDLERIAAAADEVSKLSGEKSIDVQLQGLRQLNFEDPEVVKALLEHAQTLAGKVQANGDLFQAAELLTIAKRAAEKAKLMNEVQTLQFLLDAVEKLRAEKN